MKILPYLVGKLGDFQIIKSATFLADVRIVVEEQNMNSIRVSIRFHGRCDNITFTLIETGASIFKVFEESMLGKPNFFEFAGLVPNSMYRMKAVTQVDQFKAENEIQAPTKPGPATLLKVKTIQDSSVELTFGFQGDATTFRYKVFDHGEQSEILEDSMIFEPVQVLTFGPQMLGLKLITQLEGFIRGDEKEFFIGIGIIKSYEFYQTEKTEIGRPLVFQYQVIGSIDGFRIDLDPDDFDTPRICLNLGNKCILEEVIAGKIISVGITPFCNVSCAGSTLDEEILGKPVNDTFATAPILLTGVERSNLVEGFISRSILVDYSGHVERWFFDMGHEISTTDRVGKLYFAQIKKFLINQKK